MKIPAKITAGDTLTWNDCPAKDYLGNQIDSSAYDLKYEFRGPTTLTVTASVGTGGGWTSTITPTQSTGLGAGLFYWQAIATKTAGGERHTLGSGTLEVLADLTTATSGYDGRSQSEIDLDAVRAAIRALVSGGAVAEYTIGNRSVRKLGLADLRALESQLAIRVARERKAQKLANGLGNPSNVFVRFT